MPPRSNPTARQERLGAELRKMRERAGFTARDAAAFLASNPMQMSHVESGRSGISEERVRRLADYYRCDDRAYVDALVEMANERGRGWWEEYRGILHPWALDLAELEHHAVRLRTFQVVHIPGILQTEDHMRAAFSYVNTGLPRQDLEAEVAFRIRRRSVLESQPPTRFDAIIHEAALRIKVGGAKVARVQLETILDLSEQDNVTIRVIPFDVDTFAGAGFSMLYAEGRVPQLDTVQVDTAHGNLLLHAEAHLAKHRALLDKVAESALDADASRDLIQRVARDL